MDLGRSAWRCVSDNEPGCCRLWQLHLVIDGILTADSHPHTHSDHACRNYACRNHACRVFRINLEVLLDRAGRLRL
jgi:hypothetical protein